MLKNMKIGKRLIIAFIMVAIIISVAGFVGLGLLVSMNTNYSKALVVNGFVQGDIGDYNTYLNQGGAIVRDIIMLTDKDDLQAAQAELDTIKVKTQAALDAAKVNCNTPEELSIIAKIDAAAPRFKDARDRAIALGLQNKNDEALKVFREEARPYLNECMSGGQELMELNGSMGSTVSTNLSNQSKTGEIIIIITIAVGFIISVLLSIVISRGISIPIGEIEVSAQKMAMGDFDVSITHTSSDELGLLADSMRQMISTTKEIVMDTSRGLNEIANGNFDVTPKADFVGVFGEIEKAMGKIIMDLSKTMSQIKISADQVSNGSDQVSCGAQALAQGATEQASSVQELSASIAEVAQQIKANAANAVAANGVAGSVGNAIHTSSEQMTEMMGAMTEISSSSTEISKIIKTIEDIAFQTNILALNAAVEAARAGAAGKGFAVVADEVRNLATKSSEAAKQTNVLIEGSVHSVEHGVSVADATAKSLAEVVSGAKEITSLIAKISQASSEQSNSIAQINLGVEQISSVVQTNSATSEESAGASEELNGQANMMKVLMSKFNLKDSGENTFE